jgi:hypothetical protein
MTMNISVMKYLVSMIGPQVTMVLLGVAVKAC